MNDTCIIICTRPESVRLHRKAFLKVGGVPAIEHILTRLIGCHLPVILAIPVNCKDYNYLIDKFSYELDVRLFEGDPRSPLHRTAEYLSKYNVFEWFVRITHDDILIDQKTMLDLVEECHKKEAGYGITPTIIEGAGVEVIQTANLTDAAQRHPEPTEYISYHVKSSPYPLQIRMKPRPQIERDYRLTMDYMDDWTLLDTILTQLGPFVSLDKVCEFIDKNIYLLNLNKLPLISVYTCAYNAEKWIDETITSVLNQTFTDYEYIIVDDGSTDITPIIISSHMYDKKIRFVRNSFNAGLATRSNEAIAMAKGKYVLRLDADDRLMQNSLNRMVRFMEQEKAGFYYFSYNETDEEGTTTNLNCRPDVHHHVGGALMNRNLMNEIRLSDGLKHWDSLDLYNRIKDKGFDIKYASEAMWYYRKHDKSLSAHESPERKEALKKVNG